jgi:hypothetical protein
MAMKNRQLPLASVDRETRARVESAGFATAGLPQL